jgi:hypothetical protein
MKRGRGGPATTDVSLFEAKVRREFTELAVKLQQASGNNADELQRLEELFDVLIDELRIYRAKERRSALQIIVRTAAAVGLGKLVNELLDRFFEGH